MPERPDGKDGAASLGASWEETRRRHLTLGLGATPAERLRWLEEMLVLAYHSGALERRRRSKLSLGASKV